MPAVEVSTTPTASAVTVTLACADFKGMVISRPSEAPTLTVMPLIVVTANPADSATMVYSPGEMDSNA